MTIPVGGCIGKRPSRSHASPDMATHTKPDVWRTVKAISRGVQQSAIDGLDRVLRNGPVRNDFLRPPG